MLPFIIGGKESVILQKPGQPKVGDVVLAWVNNSRYVVHRIIKIEGEDVTLMGDGNISGTERCTLSDVKALATHVVGRDERPRDLYSPWRKRAAKAWLMQPVVFGRAKRMGICCGSALVIVLVIAATHIGQTLWISQHDTELATPATSSADASSI